MNASGGNAARGRTNRGVALWLAVGCVLLLAYLLAQDWVYQEQRDGFWLGFFSVVGVVAMLACAVSLVFDRRRGETTPEMATVTLRQALRALAGLAIMGVFFILAWDDQFSQPWLRALLDVIPLTGEFMLWAAGFLALGMYLLGVRPFASAIVSGVVTSVIIYGLFRLIGISLPTHILPG